MNIKYSKDDIIDIRELLERKRSDFESSGDNGYYCHFTN